MDYRIYGRKKEVKKKWLLNYIILIYLKSYLNAMVSLLLAWFLDVLLAIVYAYMGIRFPGQNMVQYSITILGK